MRSSPSLLTRALEPWVSGLWIVFVLVSLAVGGVWTLGLDDAHLARWVPNRELVSVLQWILRQLDLFWITLAAVNAHLCLIQREGVNSARRWILGIVLIVGALAWVSVRTGFPLGWIQYGPALGMRLGPIRLPIPLGLPLFWFSVIVGAREGMLRFFPRWSHLRIALGTGLLVLITDVSLEPLAAKLRGFWLWRAGAPSLPPLFDAPPWSGLVWGIAAGLLVFFLREQNVVAATRSRSWQPAAALVIFHLIFLAAHIGRACRL